MKRNEIRQIDSTTLRLSLDGKPKASLRMWVLVPGNNGLNNPLPCDVDSLTATSQGLRIEWKQPEKGVFAALDLTPVEGGFQGRLASWGQGYVIVRLVVEIPAQSDDFPFMPAFMYGDNAGGQSPRAMYPQLQKAPGISWARPWISEEWLVRTDRASHGFSAVIANDHACAIGGRDVARYADGAVAEKTGLGISSTHPRRLSFSMGFANVPLTYSAVSGRNFFSRPEGYMDLNRGKVTAECFLLLETCATRAQGAGQLLRRSYALLHDPIQEAGTVRQAIAAVAGALVDYGYSPEAKNFHAALYEDMRITQVHDSHFSSAWAGGSRTAYPLLAAGLQHPDAGWRRIGCEVLDNLADWGYSPRSGLFYDNYDLTKKEWNCRGWWYECLEQPGHSGYVNGQVCHYLLLGYVKEKEAGVEHANWLTSARKVLDHVVAVQGRQGQFGYTYRESDGQILDDTGFSGCWFVPALATLHRITGESEYLTAARRAMDYYRRYVQAFQVYGGPHDIYKSPDEEGILAWITAAHFLHEITGESQFLTDLLMGLDYEFSWKFAYNVVNEVEPLKSMNWCSTGGSVTSVNNSHIHPMGSAIIDSIRYAGEATGDPYLRSRLIDTVRWTLTTYLHYDGHYGWGKKGMINERFCYTDSLLLERFPDGQPAGTWFCGHSWASGAVLEGLIGKMIDYDFRADPERHKRVGEGIDTARR